MIICVVLSGCGDPTLNVALKYDIDPTIFREIDGDSFSGIDSVFVSDTTLGIPADIFVSDSALIVIDLSSGAPFRYYDIQTGELLDSVGVIGEGPMEFGRPWSFEAHEDTLVRVYDAGLRRYSVLSRIPRGKQSVLEQHQIEVDGFPLDVVDFSDGQLLVNGIFATNRFVEYNQTGDIIREFGKIPVSTYTPRAPLNYRGEAHLSPDRTKIALAMGGADVIEIYNRSGSLLHVIAGPELLSPNDGQKGYIDTAVTSQYIFGLLADADGEHSNLGTRIIVVDWSGNFKGTIHLKNPSFGIGVGIGVEERTGYLYSSAHIPRPEIYRLKLPQWID